MTRTIKEIAENCGYSQATFYRQFKDKYALIAWDYTRDMKAISEREEVEAVSFRQILSKGSAYCEEHRSYLANLFFHMGGYDSFVSKSNRVYVLRDRMRTWLSLFALIRDQSGGDHHED